MNIQKLAERPSQRDSRFNPFCLRQLGAVCLVALPKTLSLHAILIQMYGSSCYLVVFFLFLLNPPGQSQGDPAQVSARNFLRINEEFCTAGQPSLEDLDRLKQQGVKGVLNLRRPQENPEEQDSERKRVEELGLKYFSLPVDGANPQAEQAEEFLKIVSEKENRPLFIHCQGANRVGAFWLIYRVLNDGWDCARAEQEARQVGLRSANLVDFAKKYIQEKKPQACAP